MDDAEAFGRGLYDPAADSCAQVARYVAAWRLSHAEEGEVIVAHARRVVLGETGGHWCEPAPEQREAARQFLGELAELPPMTVQP